MIKKNHYCRAGNVKKVENERNEKNDNYGESIAIDFDTKHNKHESESSIVNKQKMLDIFLWQQHINKYTNVKFTSAHITKTINIDVYGVCVFSI